MGQSELIVSLSFIALFSLAIFGYASGFSNDNNVAISIDNNTLASNTRTNITNELVKFNVGSNNSKTSFSAITSSEGKDTEKTTGSFTFATELFDSFKYTLKYIKGTIFGGEGSQFTVITSTILGVLTLLTIMYIWKTLKGGNPN